MKKVRIHIESKLDYMDESVFVNAELPGIPSVGDQLHLTDEMMNELELKVCNDEELARKYMTEWTIEESLRYTDSFFDLDFHFDLAIKVSDVCYHVNSEIVDIQLTKQERSR